MASLIGWLADAGARKSDGTAVASGYAWFYQPGTTDTQVAVFADADGLYPLTQPLRLNAAGQGVAYAKDPLQVLIQDSTGTTVKLHDRGNTVAAAQVELENTVATGTSLTTGAQVAGGLTDLDTYLANVRTSNGAADGSVLVGATTMLLKDALKPLARIYDITAAPYSAAGDGITDDTVAVQAAITAANTAGGIVLVPPGTYKVTGLTVPSNMTFLGAGAGRSIITTTSASNVLLTASGAFTAFSVQFKTAGKGLLAFTAAVNATTVFNACILDVGSAGTVYGIDGLVNFNGLSYDTVNLIDLYGCDIIHGADNPVTTSGVLGGGVRVHGGTIFFKASSSAAIFAVCIFNVLDGVYVEWDGTGAGSLYSSNFGTTINAITNTTFAATSTGAFHVAGSSTIVESGCDFIQGGSGVVAFTAQPFRSSERRDSNSDQSSGSATSKTPAPLTYRLVAYVSTGASFQWNNPTDAGGTYAGYDLILWYKNTSGGPITPTLDTIYKGTTVSVANNSACCWHFVWNSTLTKYVQVGTVAAYAA